MFNKHSPSHPSSLCLVAILFLWARVTIPLPNPQPGGPVESLFVWPLPFDLTPANIALGVTGAHKVPHYDKVVISIEAVDKHLSINDNTDFLCH